MFTAEYAKDQVIQVPIAHGEGNYTCDEETLASLKANNQIVFTYTNDNPNGSVEDIAGIINERGNVLRDDATSRTCSARTDWWNRRTSTYSNQSLNSGGNLMSVMLEPNPQQIKDQKLYAQMGMSDAEFEMVENILGRLPNYTETGLFSVMWSEHCSYKNSKPVLRKFPTTGPRVFKVLVKVLESLISVMAKQLFSKWNHIIIHLQSNLIQGAATGVGGIIRDVFSMGARPIAMLNSFVLGN